MNVELGVGDGVGLLVTAGCWLAIGAAVGGGGGWEAAEPFGEADGLEGEGGCWSGFWDGTTGFTAGDAAGFGDAGGELVALDWGGEGGDGMPAVFGIPGAGDPAYQVPVMSHISEGDYHWQGQLLRQLPWSLQQQRGVALRNTLRLVVRT